MKINKHPNRPKKQNVEEKNGEFEEIFCLVALGIILYT